MRPAYASKPDASRAAIVSALKHVGASYVDLQGRKGTPDLAVGFRGRMWLAEIKAPEKKSGVCGCTSTKGETCGGGSPSNIARYNAYCDCKGHLGNGNAERKTWHAQLAFREAWKGPPVVVWTTPQEAIDTITKETTK